MPKKSAGEDPVAIDTGAEPKPTKPKRATVTATATKPKATTATATTTATKPKATTKPAKDKPKGAEKPKKRNIPKRVKDLCWEKWVGKDIGSHTCLCCETTIIRMNSFHCGHVIAEADGGGVEPDNLRPICADCNLSMGKENFNDFKARCGFVKPKAVKAKAVKAKAPKAKANAQEKKLIDLLINAIIEKKI